MAPQIERRLAVVLAADVVGYSRLMGTDDEGTLAALNAVRRDIVDPRVREYRGRMVRTMGDGLIVEFSSVVDAVNCAVTIQREMADGGVDVPIERQIRFRIGINVGDVVSDGEAIYGDGIAVASRLESLAPTGGVTISRGVRDQVRDQLPLTFTDLGEHPVPNLARPVRAFRVMFDDDAAPHQPTAEPRKTASTERPGIAVLPFQSLGGDAEVEFLLDSIAEDLITELARARWFSVTARNTAFSYKGKGTDAKQIARELGVRYVMEGSLRKAGGRVRISCDLADAESGQHLWAERFEGTLEDSFDLQDRITESVIGAVGPVLRAAEIERIARKPARSDPYQLTLLAISAGFAETAEQNETALRLVNEAIGIDPHDPMANALAAWCHQQRHLFEWPGVQHSDREIAKRRARIAFDHGSDVPLAIAVAGAVRAALTRDHSLAVAAADRATALCNNSALVLGLDAMTRTICGDYEKAIAHGEKAIRLSPREPLLYHASLAVALALLLCDRCEEAIGRARKAVESNPKLVLAHAVVAAGLAQLGRSEEAGVAVEQLLAAAPNFRAGTLRRIRFADNSKLQAAIASLRDAGLPD